MKQNQNNRWNTNQGEWQKAAEKGDISKIAGSLSKEELAKVQAILNDKEQLQKIIDSPFGKAFLKNKNQ